MSKSNTYKDQRLIEALIQGDGFLDAIFDSTNNAIIILQPVSDSAGDIEDYDVIMANQKVIDMLQGKSPVGHRCTKFFPCFIKDSIFDNFNNIIRTEKPANFVQEFKEDGLNGHFRIIAKKAGEFLIVTLEDIAESNITDLKTEEDSIRQQLHILKQAEELTRSGSWEYNIITKEFLWSDGMYELFRINRGLMVTPFIYLEFAIEEDKNIAEEIVKAVQQTFEAFEETLRIKASGTIKILKVKGTA